MRKTELRMALHDELASLWAINTSLRYVFNESDRLTLFEARHDCLTVVRHLLSQLHPAIRKVVLCPKVN
jgi:hypothetical protein